ncbi:MAG TPA: DUF4410 domain-containing protein, partial [Candidatus Dormibacteraeota bacterium]|nr:DUF4410 domain-containing protein [Candidatus Dormibacteraeota bacterium]
MAKRWLPVLLLAALFPLVSVAGDKPVIVVHAFTMGPGTTWPYDMKQMQTEAVAELQAKFGKQFDIVTLPPTETHGKIYTLDGEVTGWRPGNRAERSIWGQWGVGRESADIHFWVTDETGEKKLDTRDTIRAELAG